MMKKFVGLIFIGLFSSLLFAEEGDGKFAPSKKEVPAYVVFGPRLGAGMVFQSQEEFSEEMRNLFSGGPYYPYYSVFGFNLEWRYLLGESSDHFALQLLLMGMGVEQSIFIPVGALMMGYRHHSGFEFGAGPLANVSGIGVVIAMGYTYVRNGVYIPFNIAFQIPNYRFKPAITVLGGFNFRIE